MKITSFILFVCAALVTFPPFAVAEEADPCAIIAEEIIDLRPPELDKPLKWKRTYGVEGEDKIVALVPLADQGVAAVGMTTPIEKSANSSSEVIAIAPVLYVNRHDKTGKLIWEKRHSIKNLVRVADAVVMKDKIIIAVDVGHKKSGSVALISVDGLGGKIAEDMIEDSSQNLSARALISDAGGASVTIAMNAMGFKKNDVAITKILRRDLSGKTVFDRDYLADNASRIQDFKRLPDGSIIAVGRARIAGNRMGGWVLRLTDKGDIIASDLFPRGTQAELNAVDVLPNGDVIVAGQVLGSNLGRDLAAWVMRVNSEMRPVWQHYIRGTYAYDSAKVLALPDGRAQILVSAKAIDGGDDTQKGRDHARVLTYTAEGRLTDMESFIEGSNANPFDLILQGNSRVIAGRAQTGFSNAAYDSAAYRATYDAWLAGLALPKVQTSSCGFISGVSQTLPDNE